MNVTTVTFFFFTHMVIPCVVFVVDDGGPKAPGRVDAGSSNGNGCQVHQKHCKSNWEWSQDLHSWNSENKVMFKNRDIFPYTAANKYHILHGIFLDHICDSNFSWLYHLVIIYSYLEAKKVINIPEQVSVQ